MSVEDKLLELEARIEKLEEKKKKKTTPSGVSEIRAAFLRAFEGEFGIAYPGWGAKESAQAKAWLRSISLPQALHYCEIYPRWNDPWVSRQGHPFGILVAQYVKLDAWLKREEQVIHKIAEGQAREKVFLGRASSLRELEIGFDELCKRREAENLALSGAVQDKVPLGTKAELPNGGGSPPIGYSPFDPPTIPNGFSPSDHDS